MLELLSMFPNAQVADLKITSPASGDYNCIAWAAENNLPAARYPEDWWWPDRNWSDLVFWPDGCPWEETVAAFICAFKTLRYQECESGDLEDGFEKVALYTIGDRPTHMAKQLSDGSWTSKIGESHDVIHTSPEVLEDDSADALYGRVRLYMKRPVVNPPQTATLMERLGYEDPQAPRGP